jgi:hypothetical protein
VDDCPGKKITATSKHGAMVVPQIWSRKRGEGGKREASNPCRHPSELPSCAGEALRWWCDVAKRDGVPTVARIGLHPSHLVGVTPPMLGLSYIKIE